MNNCTPCSHCERRLTSSSVAVNTAGTAVNIAVAIDGTLKEETKYCLILAQPCPVAGFHLPVSLIVTSDDTGDTVTVPLKKLFSQCGMPCLLEFGEELPKCRNRIPLFYTNGNDFIDLRRHEHVCYCG